MEKTETLTLGAIEQRVRRMAKELDAPANYLPTYGRSREDGTPHIEINGAYDFVVSERGKEFERRSSSDIDELLYWVFRTVTFSLAADYECGHRRAGEDSRRQLFAIQLDMLKKLSPDWAEREDAYLRGVLRQHPFQDRWT